jgi:hypothetical protein
MASTNVAEGEELGSNLLRAKHWRLGFVFAQPFTPKLGDFCAVPQRIAGYRISAYGGIFVEWVPNHGRCSTGPRSGLPSAQLRHGRTLMGSLARLEKGTLGFQGPAQPSSALGDALNAG